MDISQIMEIIDQVYQDMFVETVLKFKVLEKSVDVGSAGRVAHQERLDGMCKLYTKLIKELYQYDA